MAIENAGHPHAKAYPALLENLAATLDVAAPTGPVVLLIGEVCARASAAKPHDASAFEASSRIAQ